MNTIFELGVSNALVATLLALAAFAVTRFIRRPHLVFAIWLLVLGKLVVPPLIGLPLASLRTAPAIPATMPDAEPPLQFNFVSAEPAPGVALNVPTEDADSITEIAFDDPPSENFVEDRSYVQDLSRLVTATIAVWLAGTIVWFALAAIRIARFRKILRHAEPARSELLDEVAGLANRVGLRHAPQVRLVHRRGPPLVWAMAGRATIVLPAELLPALSDEQRRALLTHELVHLARRDHLVRWAELAALGLYWWHPIAWWARGNVERAAEQCCDAEVVALMGSARAYAEALLATVDFLAESGSPLPMGASGFSQVLHLKRRMEMILHPTTGRPAAWPLRIVLLAIGLTVLPLSIRALWAEPVSAAAEPASTPQAVPAPASQPVNPANSSSEKQEPTVPESVQVAPQSKLPVDASSAIEERLDRLEKMIQALSEQKQASTPLPVTPRIPRAVTPKTPTFLNSPKITHTPGIPKPGPADPKIATVPTQKDAPDQPEPVTWRFGTGESEMQVQTDRIERIELTPSVEKSLAEFRHLADANVKLSETNYARRVAAERQFEAVNAAYAAETVTLDQLLEAQRRLAEARISYARTVCDLATDPAKREYVFALACLQASNQALNDARRIWKHVHATYIEGSQGKEAEEEALAREQYFQFKSQTQGLLNLYLKAKATYEGRDSNVGPHPEKPKL